MFLTWDRDGRVRSESIQPFGAATKRPASPHYNDQEPLFAQHKLKPVLFDPAALKASGARRSEEHTSELQSLMRISYAVFCLKKKTQKNISLKTNIYYVIIIYIMI